MSTYVENGSGDFVPAVPLPLYLVVGTKCKCGKFFLLERNYRGHYALVHILHLE
jgi:hypothetical protein